MFEAMAKQRAIIRKAILVMSFSCGRPLSYVSLNEAIHFRPLLHPRWPGQQGGMQKYIAKIFLSQAKDC
jgi:hypothetical protein